MLFGTLLMGFGFLLSRMWDPPAAAPAHFSPLQLATLARADEALTKLQQLEQSMPGIRSELDQHSVALATDVEDTDADKVSFPSSLTVTRSVRVSSAFVTTHLNFLLC